MNAIIYLNRGDVKSKSGDHQDAINDYMDAIRRNANLPEAYMQMGKAKSHMGYLAEAIADQEKALNMEPGYKPWVFYNIASHYAFAGNKEMMMTWLKKAKKEGYFKLRENVRDFEKNDDFKAFRNDAELREFSAAIK
jgi:tetratricopeptide (TPR) repeat protein